MLAFADTVGRQSKARSRRVMTHQQCRCLGHAQRVLTFAIAIAVFVATSLQMLVSLVDVHLAHRLALEVARAEDDLIREQSFLKRRRVGREVRSWRDQDTERSLAYVDVIAFSWTLLVAASGAATVQAAVNLF